MCCALQGIPISSRAYSRPDLSFFAPLQSPSLLLSLGSTQRLGGCSSVADNALSQKKRTSKKERDNVVESYSALLCVHSFLSGPLWHTPPLAPPTALHMPAVPAVCPQHSLCHHAQGYTVDSYGSLESRHRVAHTHEWCSTRRQSYSSLTNTWGHIIRLDHGQCMHNETKGGSQCVVKMQLKQIQQANKQCMRTLW